MLDFKTVLLMLLRLISCRFLLLPVKRHNKRAVRRYLTVLCASGQNLNLKQGYAASIFLPHATCVCLWLHFRLLWGKCLPYTWNWVCRRDMDLFSDFHEFFGSYAACVWRCTKPETCGRENHKKMKQRHAPQWPRSTLWNTKWHAACQPWATRDSQIGMA